MNASLETQRKLLNYPLSDITKVIFWGMFPKVQRNEMFGTHHLLYGLVNKSSDVSQILLHTSPCWSSDVLSKRLEGFFMPAQEGVRTKRQVPHISPSVWEAVDTADQIREIDRETEITPVDLLFGLIGTKKINMALQTLMTLERPMLTKSEVQEVSVQLQFVNRILRVSGALERVHV